MNQPIVIRDGKIAVYHTPIGAKLTAQTQPVNLTLRPAPYYQTPDYISRHLINRQSEIDIIMAALEQKRLVQIYGQPGIGKSILLHYLTRHMPKTQFSAGVVYLSARQVAFDDLCQMIFEEFYQAQPPLKPSLDQFHICFANLESLIVLDDVTLEWDDLETLITLLPQSRFLITANQRTVYALGEAVELTGLPIDETITLVEQRLADRNKLLNSAERAAVEAIATATNGHPLTTLQLVMAGQPATGFDSQRLSENAYQLSQNATPYSVIQMVTTDLTPAEQALLQPLISLPGVPISKEQLWALVAPSQSDVEQLRQRHLVIVEGEDCRVATNLSWGLWETDFQHTLEDLLNHFGHWAKQQSSAPVLANRVALASVMNWSLKVGQWTPITGLVQAIDKALLLSRQWEMWQMMLQGGLKAAQASHNSAREAQFRHQLGVQALHRADHHTARRQFIYSLRAHQKTDSPAKNAVTQHNLRFILTPSSTQPKPQPQQPPPPPRQSNWGFLLRPVAGSSLLLLAVLLLAGLWISNIPVWFPPPTTIQLSTDRLDFNRETIGNSSLEQIIEVINFGDAILYVNEVRLDGKNPNDFNIASNTCTGRAIPLGEQCIIAVSFVPKTERRLNAELVVVSNGEASPHKIWLTGGPQPTLFVDPDILDFEDQLIDHDSPEKIISVVSNGGVPLAINNIELSEPNGRSFLLREDNCTGANLETGENCEVKLIFRPPLTTSYQAEVVINHNGQDEKNTVALQGRGVAPRACILPEDLLFAEPVVVGQPVSQMVTLQNCGSAPLNVSDIFLAMREVTTFQLEESCRDRPLAVNQSCPITITFDPSEEGSYLTNLIVVHDAPGGSPTGISIKGQAIAPKLCLDTSELRFGAIRVNEASQTRVVTLRNCGSAPLTVNRIRLTGQNGRQLGTTNEFTLSADNCNDRTLEVDASCPLNVNFSPTVAESHQLELQMETDDVEEQITTIPLSGEGIAPRLCVIETNLTFSEQAINSHSEPRRITLTNCGTATLNLEPPLIEGANRQEFIMETNTCPSGNLPVGSSCQYEIRFAPATAASKSANITLVNDGLQGTTVISLNGTGVAPQVCLNQNNLDFGQQGINQTSATQRVTLTNCGSAVLNINDTKLGGTNWLDFQYVDGCRGSRLLPNERCTFQITFIPTTAGQKLANLTIIDDTPDVPATITLNGNGIP